MLTLRNKRLYIVHRYVVRNITQYPRRHTQVWAVCDKLRVNDKNIPEIREVFLNRQEARAAAHARNLTWKAYLGRSSKK